MTHSAHCLQDALLKKYQDQIVQLQADLAAARGPLGQRASESTSGGKAEQESSSGSHSDGDVLNAAILEQVNILIACTLGTRHTSLQQ